MVSVVGFLVLAAFICTLLNAIGRVPIWIAVLFLCIVALMGVIPLK